MIVPMKKVTMVCLLGDQDAAVDRLQDMGVLHVAPVRHPESGDLDEARRLLARSERVVHILEAAAPEGAPAEAPLSADVVEQVLALQEQLDRLVEDEQQLHQEARRLAPLGDFDPASVLALADAGIHVRFFQESARAPLTGPEGVQRVVLREDGPQRTVALIGRGPFSVHGHEILLPSRSLGSVRERLAAIGAERTAAQEQLRQAAAHLPARRRASVALRDRVQCMEARAGMGAAGQVVYLCGFAPAEHVAAIRQTAAAHGWGLLIEDPSAKDRVPTLIRHPRWVRPIKVLLDFIKILPGYREADVSASFLLFLSLFCAMIIGDAGYGLLFLALTGLARRRWRRAPREPFILMTIFAACTVIWGAITGVYFGVTNIPAPLAALRIDWLNNSQNAMGLCLLIGALHLSVAHAWNAFLLRHSLQAIAQLGWLAIVWTIFLAGRSLLLGTDFPMAFAPVTIIGLLAIVIFMTPLRRLKQDWINHAMLPLTLMSNFGDILSYIRLFALGVASVQLAAAFNKIVSESIGFASVAAGLASVLLLFAGHTVNIVLSLMSVLVHGIRLNALEFSMHMGLEWTGCRYQPLTRQQVAAVPAPPEHLPATSRPDPLRSSEAAVD